MIAVLISGAIRNLSETWPENKKRLDALNQPYEIFVHSWTENFGTPRKVYKDLNSGGFVFDFKEKFYEEDTFEVSQDYIKSIIPDAHIRLDDFDEKELVTRYCLSSHVHHHLYRNLVNSVAMYQGISRVFTLSLALQERKFSHFVRIRTDFLIQDDIPRDSMNSDIFFGGPGVDPGFGYVSDQFLIVSPYIAERLADIEGYLMSYVGKNGWSLESDRPFYGERILSKFIYEIRNDIDLIEGPAIGEIKRPAVAVSKKIFSMSYLFEILDYNFGVFRKKLFKKSTQMVRFLVQILK